MNFHFSKLFMSLKSSTVILRGIWLCFKIVFFLAVVELVIVPSDSLKVVIGAGGCCTLRVYWNCNILRGPFAHCTFELTVTIPLCNVNACSISDIHELLNLSFITF